MVSLCATIVPVHSENDSAINAVSWYFSNMGLQDTHFITQL